MIGLILVPQREGVVLCEGSACFAWLMLVGQLVVVWVGGVPPGLHSLAQAVVARTISVVRMFFGSAHPRPLDVSRC